MENYTKLDRLDEHHGEDWNPAILDMTVNTFLDKLKEIDANAYAEVEQLIDRVSPQLAGMESDNELESEEEEEGEYSMDGEEGLDEIPTFSQMQPAPRGGGESMPTFGEFNM